MDEQSSAAAGLPDRRPQPPDSSAHAHDAGGDRVAEIAQQRIQIAHHRSLKHVHCEHVDGVLWLRGEVATFHHKQVAQECVRDLPGVTRILNLLNVVPRENGRQRGAG